MSAGAVTPNEDHPATYSAQLLPVLRAVMAGVADTPPSLYGPPRALDPFAGPGLKFHGLGDEVGLDTVGVELEPEWAANHPRNVVGDATRLDFPDESFDLVVTSPCYGNRMADDHDAKDPCSTCGGSGCSEEGCLGDCGVIPDGKDHARCRACKGTGLSRRNTYRHRLGRPLTKGTAANLRYVAGPRGNKYRRLHVKAWAEVHRTLRPYGLFALNVSNYLETVAGQLVEHRVTEWHLDHLITNGFRLEALHPVRTPGQRQGANGDTRTEYEFVLILRKR